MNKLRNERIDPRFRYVTRGCAPYVEWLGQKENPQGKGWAAGEKYGEKILSILKSNPSSLCCRILTLFWRVGKWENKKAGNRL